MNFNSQLEGQPNALQVLQNALLVTKDLEPANEQAAPHIPADVQGQMMDPSTTKRGKRLNKGMCQIPGCTNTLQRLRHWYKVCQMHAEATCVVLEGQLKRFCQQCSRFELMAEFDHERRSCRKRLEKHNARRRTKDDTLVPAPPPAAGAAAGRTKRVRTAPKQLWEDHTPSPNGVRSRSASPVARRMAPTRTEAAVRPYMQLSGSPATAGAVLPLPQGLLSMPQPSVAIGNIVSKLALDMVLQQPQIGGGGGGGQVHSDGGALQSTQRAQPQAIGGSGSAFVPVGATPAMNGGDGANLGMLAAAAAVAEEEQTLHAAAPALVGMGLPPPLPQHQLQHAYPPPQQPQTAASAQLENMLWSLQQQLSQAEASRMMSSLSSLMQSQMPALPAATPTPLDSILSLFMAPPPLPQHQQQQHWQLPAQGFNAGGGSGAVQDPNADMSHLVGLLSQLSQTPALLSALSSHQ